MIISSPDNIKIKNLKKLQMKKYRVEMGEFFVENLVIILDALKAGYRPISIFATEEFINKNREALEKIIQTSNLSDWFEINERINKTFSNLEHPSGICAVYKKIEPQELSFAKPIIYLNSIGDPGNLGTIIRSAVAFGFDNIVLDETCVDEYNFKTINAAKDAFFKINIFHDKNLALLKEIKEKMPLISTKMNEGENIDSLKKPVNFCLVLGDESRGVDPQIQALANSFIKINISQNIESLNVASAAAIILHSVYQK